MKNTSFNAKTKSIQMRMSNEMTNEWERDGDRENGKIEMWFEHSKQATVRYY